MSRMNILHLSDLHISKAKLGDIKIVIKALFDDIDTLLHHEISGIDYICFTGDLIQRGDLADEQYQLALDYLIFPLLEKLNLGVDRLLLIPGNHEVDRSKIDLISEEGLKSVLKTRDRVNDFLDKGIRKEHVNRLENFYSFSELIHPGQKILHNLATVHIDEILGKKIGFACLNSAWRCSGDDKEKLVIGERQIDSTLDAISDCDVKIALVHHPTFWLAEHDRFSVEARLAEFDLVLNGHLHDLSEKQIINHGQTTLYCSAGSLFDGRSSYNGYSVISLDPLTNYVDVFLREYFDSKRRRAFDKALSIAENGRVSYQLGKADKNMQFCFQILEPVLRGFTINVNQTLVSTMVDDYAPKELEKIFVEPTLSKKSEYTKEKSDTKDEVSIRDLYNGDENILFIGKKEIGKTTLLNFFALQYLNNFGTKFKIPFVLDLRSIPKGFNRIEKMMIDFIHINTNYESSASVEQIMTLLESGLCVLLFDNIEIENESSVEMLREFISKYPGNRYVLSFNESIFATIESEEIPNFGCDFTKVYIHTLTKNRIRGLVTNWFGGRDVDVNEVLERTILHLSFVGMPRTPFIVSLILATCNTQEDYIPINEASVMERFLELLLEKLSIEETKSSTYDFRNKEDFMTNLAWYMVENNKYELERSEFSDLTEAYFKKKKLNRQVSKFDSLFFEKRILVENEGTVYFRYRSILEYFIAKKAAKDTKALEFIMNENQYLNFTNEISFITGLGRDREDILLLLEDRLVGKISESINDLRLLEDYALSTDIQLDPQEIRNKLKSLELDTEQRDKLTDRPETNHQFDSQQVNKERQESSEKLDLFNLLMLYGRVIRNSEFLDGEPKSRALKLFILSICIFWAILKDFVENTLTVDHIEGLDKENGEQESVEEELEILRDVFKITMPMVLQNLAAESVGTGKLAEVMSELLDAEENEFVQFMLIFLYADLKLPGYLKKTETFIKKVGSRDLLQLTVFKLMYYYRHGHFGEGVSISRIESLIADAVIRYKNIPKHQKGQILQKIREPLVLEDFMGKIG